MCVEAGAVGEWVQADNAAPTSTEIAKLKDAIRRFILGQLQTLAKVEVPPLSDCDGSPIMAQLRRIYSRAFLIRLRTTSQRRA